LLSKALEFQDVQELSGSSKDLSSSQVKSESIPHPSTLRSPDPHKTTLSNTSIEESINYEDTITEAKESSLNKANANNTHPSKEVLESIKSPLRYPVENKAEPSDRREEPSEHSVKVSEQIASEYENTFEDFEQTFEKKNRSEKREKQTAFQAEAELFESGHDTDEKLIISDTFKD